MFHIPRIVSFTLKNQPIHFFSQRLDSTNSLSRLCSKIRYNCLTTTAFHRHSKSSLSSSSSSINNTSTLQQLLLNQQGGEIISSTKNKTIQLYTAIAKKSKARHEHNLTLLEGHRLIIDTLSNPKIKNQYRHILVTNNALQHDEFGLTLSDLIMDLIPSNFHDYESREKNEESCQVRIVTDDVLCKVSDTVTPQGIMALVDIPESYDVSNTKHTNNSPNQSSFFIVMDGVSDPGNVGTLLRSSLAIGVEAVFMLPNSCDVWNPKVVRSAMGATHQVPIKSFASWDECYGFLTKVCGVKSSNIYAATMEGSSTSPSISHYDINWCDDGKNGSEMDGFYNAALCIGKEGSGLSVDVRNAIEQGMIRSVHVPMENGIESLNAAVCGSVIMFEYYRQYNCKAKMLK